ncbi:MAG TPA: glycosyltransferase family 4 protein [Nitrospiraceae bacterium]|jgi:glycosyltransferase involved in cell wall biosynthesis|nr:glycosyltransferase family 4 protein [Nitrospiraceae bacterium]
MLARPKIALIAPSARTFGGQALHASMLTEQLKGEGYEVQFIPIDPEFSRRFRWVRRVPYIRTLVNQCLYLPGLIRLRRSDIVQASSASYWSFLLAPLPALLSGRLFGKPVVLNYHSGEAEDHLAHWGRLIHPWLKLVDEIVVPSEYLRRVFATYGYRARVIHNTIDIERFQYRVRKPLRPKFLSIRNFEWYYGVDHTIRAYALLKTRYPEATLSIVGAGSQETELKRLCRSLGIEGIRFLGAVDPADMPSVHDGADIFLNSSLIDNQPLSILEAIASGLPVVSTGVGDIVNMLEDGVTGTIVPERDSAAMAAAATRLLEYPDRARSMASQAYAQLDRYSWSRVGSQWSTLYNDIMAGNHMRRMEGIHRAA